MKKIRTIKTFIERVMDEVKAKGLIFIGEEDIDREIYRLFYSEQEDRFYQFIESNNRLGSNRGLTLIDESGDGDGWSMVNAMINRYNERLDLKEATRFSEITTSGFMSGSKSL